MYPLQPNTQVAVLLCAHTGDDPVQPLSQTEYVRLVDWLKGKGYPLEIMLSPDVSLLLLEMETHTEVSAGRVEALLGRGAQLALWLERWSNAGMWIASWGDAEYPPLLRKKLYKHAPVLLHGFGNPELLKQGGLAIVGSRRASEALLEVTRCVANRCAREGWTVVSGGAKGVDRAAMLGALEEGGTCVGVLAADLARIATSTSLRDYLLADKLCLISPYHPQSGFTVGNAMGRNKVIYALAEFALVMACEEEQGGTWAGAVENLRNGWTPLFVYVGENAPSDNNSLLAYNAYPFVPSEGEMLREQLHNRLRMAPVGQLALPIQAT
ncbi:MAG: DNA-processing protein DprA [Armatimonadota bacterium]|nr:DNA-processing protein DprA [Armatimonadota bacterium]